MAQETTENPIRSSRTSLTMGPASMTCFSTWVSKSPAVSGRTGKTSSTGTIKDASSGRSASTSLYNGFDVAVSIILTIFIRVLGYILVFTSNKGTMHEKDHGTPGSAASFSTSSRRRASTPPPRSIYRDARRVLPNISLGTVYRNLNFLRDQGTVREIRPCEGGSSRFDGVGHPPRALPLHPLQRAARHPAASRPRRPPVRGGADLGRFPRRPAPHRLLLRVRGGGDALIRESAFRKRKRGPFGPLSVSVIPTVSLTRACGPLRRPTSPACRS